MTGPPGHTSPDGTDPDGTDLDGPDPQVTDPQVTDPPDRHDRHRHARPVEPVLDRSRPLRLLAVALVGIAAAAGALVSLGDVRADVGPVEARLSVELSFNGGTEVEVPPVGRLTMGTHTGPLQLRADVRNVDVEAVTAMIRDGDPLPTVETMSADVRSGVVRLALRGVTVGLLGAALAGALVFRRPGAVLLGTGAAAGALALSGGVAVATFSSQALEEPQYEGLLAQAPALVGGVSRAAGAVDAYGARLAELTGNVSQLYGALGSLPEVPGPDTTTVLWVSDVHNNPAAYGVMGELIDQFGVEAVVDTGDSTDIGSAAENLLLNDIEDLGVPYLWVRGNHDSATTQRHMAGLVNVTVLDGPQVSEVAGVRWAGIGDPRYTPVKRIAEPSEVGRRELRAAGQRLATGLRAGGEAADVVLVHESPMAEPLLGQVPLVLDGHVHERRERRVDGTLELTLGSSGGAGLRTFDGGGDPLPLAMTILHLDPADGSLVAVDEVTLTGLGSETITFQRRTATSLAPEPEPASEAEPPP